MADAGSIAVTDNYRIEYPTLLPSINTITASAVQVTPQRLNSQIPGSWGSSTTVIAPSLAYNTSYTRVLPTWAFDVRNYFPNTLTPSIGVNVSGSITGTVKENGNPVAGKLVGLYYRPSMQLIMSLRSGVAGAYSFTGLEPGSTDYFIIAINNKPLQFDAVVHDTITAT